MIAVLAFGQVLAFGLHHVVVLVFRRRGFFGVVGSGALTRDLAPEIPCWSQPRPTQ